jgi:hypothetical protein
MESIKQENSNNNNNNNNNHLSNHHPYSDKIVHGSSQEIAEITADKRLIEPGSHNLLVIQRPEVIS